MVERFLGDSFLPSKSPTDSNFKNIHSRLEHEDVSPGLYNQLIGSLLWISQCTRPDVSFAVNKLSQFSKIPLSTTGRQVSEYFATCTSPKISA